MAAAFDFQLTQPNQFTDNEPVNQWVQALWYAAVGASSETTVSKRLYSDAATGLLFCLKGQAYLDDEPIAAGSCVYLPVSAQAHTIHLALDTLMVGVRWYPGVKIRGLSSSGMSIPEPAYSQMNLDRLLAGFNRLADARPYDYIRLLASWLEDMEAWIDLPPSYLGQVLESIRQTHGVEKLGNDLNHHRQLQRQCARYLGLSLKHYQRIVRVKQTLQALKMSPDITLTDMAYQWGFSDQAHMTRECKAIAKVTPGQYLRALS